MLSETPQILERHLVSIAAHSNSALLLQYNCVPLQARIFPQVFELCMSYKKLQSSKFSARRRERNSLHNMQLSVNMHKSDTRCLDIIMSMCLCLKICQKMQNYQTLKEILQIYSVSVNQINVLSALGYNRLQ